MVSSRHAHQSLRLADCTVTLEHELALENGMRLKEVGKKIQLIRPIYVPENRRTREKMVASISSEAIGVPFDIAPLLTPEEIKQVEISLKSRYLMKLNESRIAYLKTGFRAAGTQFLDALSGFEIVDKLTSEEVADLWSLLQRIEWAMEKAKLPRPKVNWNRGV